MYVIPHFVKLSFLLFVMFYSCHLHHWLITKDVPLNGLLVFLLFRLGRRSRTACPGSSDYWLSELRKPGPHKARRRDGYAAAEKEVNRKSIQLCAIGSNDFIG